MMPPQGRPQGPPPGQPPLGAAPPGPPADMDKLNSMRSGFNPTDASMNAIDGNFDPDKNTVIELLQMQGIDPQGPASQLKEFFMKSMKNADPINKMRGIAAAQGPGGPPPGAPPGGPPPGRPPGPPPPQGGIGPQFDKLMNR